MRILQICNKTPYPVKDGGALAIHNLSKGLAGAGHEVSILAMHTSKHSVNKSKVTDYFKSLKINIEFVDVNSDLSFLKALLNLLFSQKPYNVTRFITTAFTNKLIGVLKKNSFDVIQLEGAYVIPYIETIRKYSKAKISFRAHNIEHEIWARFASKQTNPVKKIYISVLSNRIRQFERKALNKYDLIIPITHRDNEIFRKLGNTRPSFVCPYAFDFSENTVQNDQFVKINSLFFIGSLDWLPNQEALYWFISKVWTEVVKACPETYFHVAGRNAPEDFLKRIAGNNIIYEGEVESAKEFMKDKQVLIAPLFSGSGMRVKIVEAMALGKTIISTTIGVEGIDVTNNTNILIADNIADFKAAVIKILNDTSFCLQIGKNAAKFVKIQLDNREVISRLVNFYKKHL